MIDYTVSLVFSLLFFQWPCVVMVDTQYLDFDNLPDTNFTCAGKVIGGYYADLETSCQMFHVCVIGMCYLLPLVLKCDWLLFFHMVMFKNIFVFCFVSLQTDWLIQVKVRSRWTLNFYVLMGRCLTKRRVYVKGWTRWIVPNQNVSII